MHEPTMRMPGYSAAASRNARELVNDADGPIRGLFAAGEITGHFDGSVPNAVAMLRALEFGRIAGKKAIELA